MSFFVDDAAGACAGPAGDSEGLIEPSSTLALAIQNLTDVCEAVLLASGHPSTRTQYLWSNGHDLNLPYPNLITLADEHSADEMYSEIRTFMESRAIGKVTGVNDAHSSLDLGQFGLSVLFSSPWSVRQPAPAEVAGPDDLEIIEINNPAQLAEFEKSSHEGFGKEWRDRSYQDVLLDDSRFRFYAARIEDRVVSGVQAFNNGNSIGFYTLFTIPDARRQGFGDAVIRAGLSNSPHLPAITNPSDQSNGIFSRLGFDKVGTRTVWLTCA